MMLHHLVRRRCGGSLCIHSAAAIRFCSTTSTVRRPPGGRQVPITNLSAASSGGMREGVATPASDDHPRHIFLDDEPIEGRRVQTLRTEEELGESSGNLAMLVGLFGPLMALYLAYCFTTRTYVLTKDPSPFSNTLLQHYPSDMCIVENRWTGRRTVVMASDDELTEGVVDGMHATSTNMEEEKTNAVAPIVGSHFPRRSIRVNSLLSRVHVYLQRCTSTVVVDLNALNKQPSTSPGSSGGKVGGQLLIASDVRMRATKNGYSKGHWARFERTVAAVTERRLKEHLAAKPHEQGQGSGSQSSRMASLLEPRALPVPSSTAIRAEFTPVVLKQFAEGVLGEVRERLGDAVILYGFSIQMVG